MRPPRPRLVTAHATVDGDALFTEAVALWAGDNITPNAGHVRAVVDRLLNLSRRTERLAELVSTLLDRTGGQIVADGGRKEWNSKTTEPDGSQH